MSRIPPADTGIVGRSATDLARAIGARELSAADVVRAFLARIEQVNGAVNAVCTPAPEALAEAVEADRRLGRGEPARPLEGVPFVVKDNIHTRGLRTTFGSQTMADFVPEADSVSVERLRAAGAILLGKANTPEFAHDVCTTNRLFGPTRNPWDLATTAGGSSGGTAAAVAAGMAPFGLGTDLGGSIRLPAAFCGIFGLRPAPGRVPAHPSDFGWDTLVQHVEGPMARSVADLGLVLSVIAGPDDRDPSSLPGQGVDFAGAARGTSALSGARIAFTADLGGLVSPDPEVAEIAAAAAGRFKALGCTVSTDCFDASDLPEIIAGTRAYAMTVRHGERARADPERLTAVLLQQVEDASRVDVPAIGRAERRRTAYWHRVRSFLREHDYILTPTTGTTAFRLDGADPSADGVAAVERLRQTVLLTYAFSVTGLPAISVPCGFTRAGLPVGLQIVGPRLREDLVLRAAAAYAAAYPAENLP